MSDAFDGRVRQLVHELHDAAPTPHDWDDLAIISPRAAARQRVWLVVAAVAVVGLVVAGIIAIGVRPDPRSPVDEPVTSSGVTPATTIAATPPTIVPPTKTETSTETDPSSTPISVSYRDPPPALPLSTLATIEIPAEADEPERMPLVAVLDGGGIAVVDQVNGRIVVADPSGATRTVSLAVGVPPPVLMVGGPGDVVYGVIQQSTPDNPAGGSIVAISLVGATAGTVIASTPASMVRFAEASSALLGHGSDGIIDSETGDLLLGYVDANGNPLTPNIGATTYTIDDHDTIRGEDGQGRWQLGITRDPGYRGSSLFPAVQPAALPDGRVAYSTTIGPAVDPSQDYPSPTLPVIALLDPDGTGNWHSLVDDWTATFSDLWGVAFARRLGNTVELATLPTTPPPPAIAEGDLVVAELRATTEGLNVAPSPVKFRLVEQPDGPYLEIILDGVVPAASAVLWTITIDGTVHGKSSANTGSTKGYRLTTEQYQQGVTVLLSATDQHDTVIQSTGNVFVGP